MRQRLLESIAENILLKPYRMLLVVAAISVACLAYASELPYSTSRIDLIPTNHPARARFLELVDEFGPQNPVAVVIEGGTPEARRRLSDRAVERLRADPDFQGTLFQRIDLEPMKLRGPYYLDLETLEEMFETVKSSRGFLHALPDVGASLAELNFTLDDRQKRGMEALEGLIPDCRRVEELFRIIDSQLAGAALGRDDWSRVLGSGKIAALDLFDEEGYLVSSDGSLHFVFITPDKQSEELEYLIPYVGRIRAHFTSAAAGLPDVRWSLAGIPISVLDEWKSTRQDLPRSTLAAFIGNLIILLLGMRRRPHLGLLAMLSLGAGIAWTLAFAKATLGYLNLISSVFALFLLGMGINYGIYLITRFDVERRRGVRPDVAMHTVVREQGLGILTSALAGALAFFCLCLSPFRGFQELGLIAGGGLLLCLAATTLMLPALVLLTERFSLDTSYRVETRIFHRIVHLVEGYPVAIVSILTVVTLCAGVIGEPFPFDYDLNRMLPEGSESLVAGEKLLDAGTLSPLSAIVICDDLEQLYVRDRALRERELVRMTLSWASFVPADLERKRELLHQIRDYLREHPVGSELPGPVNLHAVHWEIGRLRGALDDSARTLDALAYHPEAQAMFGALWRVDRVRARLAAMTPAREREALSELGVALRQSWRGLVDEVEEWSAVSLPTPELVPPALRQALGSPSGRYAIFVSPRDDINQKSPFLRFHGVVSEVDPDLTGYPVIIHTMVGLLPSVLEYTSFMAVTVIGLLLAVDLRSPRRVFLAIFPVIIGAVWLMGLMKLFGIQYNPVNFLALPMILGIGIENGVNFVHGFRAEDSAEALETQGRGMILSAGTSILGFQALALVSHRGLASFGMILTLGTTTCLLASLFFLPAVVEIEAHGGRFRDRFTELMGHRFF